ncbi:hypothetical protein ISF_04432 [Cordyceps fumosorosea ARSEF 2679]|uniref:Uncharacterized protein n=1 Tax=Cordyceps fumosorosea (strain ARSEF 2679) TaxID=1081104 RepID=A0A162J7U2_CORFA|nr:hypothetical protein ISF_04432 [Cordyceps fumosorosea ARSEF 2679]OAA65022.1 hypothetical protein ISF_04432 [Cordyceps fumosorosea ARSEF 2679]
MAAVATSTNARPPGSYMANSDGANTLPRRGLAHLVDKFETLDKANNGGAPRRKLSNPRQQGAGLTASKTMSSLNSLQDNRRYLENAPYRKDERLELLPAAAEPGRTNISPWKPHVAPPKNAHHRDRLSTVAETRKIFESEEPAPKANLDTQGFN